MDERNETKGVPAVGFVEIVEKGALTVYVIGGHNGS